MNLPPRSYQPRGRAARKGRSEVHRRFIRQHLCVAWERKDCAGPIDCCHARDLCPHSERGMSLKPPDHWTYPACRKHHREAEKRETDFGREYGLDMRGICLGLAAQSPDKAIREAAKAAFPEPQEGEQG